MTTRSILVTGASKGIGRAVALRLAKDGFAPILHYNQDRKSVEETLALVEENGVPARIIGFDIADRADARDQLEADMQSNGAYYGVVLNAGIARDNNFPSMSDREWDDVIGTNLNGFYNVLRPAVMPMVSAHAGGRIVTLSSVAGIAGNRGQVNYSASKAGIIGATKALAVELAKRSITVNCVAPGMIDTQMTAGLTAEDITAVIPMRRMGTSEEVAAAVAFLCSDEASYITRQVISVNGGMI